MVHEIYRSPPNTGSDRVSELSIMWLSGGGSNGVSAGGQGRGRTRRGSAESRLVHIRHIHIGGFGPPVERYFIMVGARRQRGAGDPSERERGLSSRGADWAPGDGVPRTLPGRRCGSSCVGTTEGAAADLARQFRSRSHMDS